MAYDYKGTKITGKSSTAKVFSKSGIKNATKGDTYFNTETGHVYKCTEGGKADEAKWKYTKTDIAKKPTVSVTSLGAPVRQNGNHKMKAEWKVPSAMVDKEKGDRATALDICWYLGIKGKDPKEVIHTKNENQTQSTINLNDLTIGSKTYTRSSFYPFKRKFLNYVTCKVISKNSKGAGASAKSTRKFQKPRKPSISAFTFNTETGELSCTITTDAGADYKERYDTRYKMTVYYSSTKTTSTIHDDHTTDTSKTLKFDDKNYAARSYSDYAHVTVYAWARGYAGASETVSRDYYIAYPRQAIITNVKVSSKTSSGKCTIYVDTKSNAKGAKAHPIDRVKLEYLADVEYALADAIPAGASWETTDIMDDGQCKALAMPVADLIPERGNYTWVRLKTYHASETVLYRYSNYYRVKALETPEATAADDVIKILSATAGADGESAVVELVWDDGQTPSTGTELTWDTDENAWKSTKEPSSHEFTWSDGERTVDNVTWPGSAEITIKDLEEGEAYFVKARRYLEGDTVSYSEYSNAATVIPNEKPEAVVATADRYIARGSSLSVYWTFSGNGLQKEWQILAKSGMAETFTGNGTNKVFTVSSEVESVTSVKINGTATSAYTRSGQTFTFNSAPANNATIAIEYEAFATVVANGEGSLGATQIDAERISACADNNNMTFIVMVSTGSGFVTSEEHTVTIIDKPTLNVTATSTLTAQPLSFTAVASVQSDLIVIVTGQGAVGQFPQGVLRQTAGDTIHSDLYTPEWAMLYAQTTDTTVLDKRYYKYQNSTYTAVEPVGTENPANEGWYEESGGVSTTIELPAGLDFWDKGTYTLSVTAIDRQTELHSDENISNFTVAWSHPAPSPAPTEVYALSHDTSASDNKNYYEYDSQTQTYIVVDSDSTDNPSQEGWYEVTITNYVTVTPVNSTDENGVHHLAAQIALTPPPNYAQTDVYDIYRMTGDGAYLIGQGFPLTYTATDEYAPFGEDMTNYYRIAVRTADGDVSFYDAEYVLEYDGIRLDFANGYVEYPYGVSIGDSYKKDVDIRHHLNGGVNGYWNEGIERKGSLGTETIKVIQRSDIDMTRQIARYTGPVFVRTKEGTAFEGDVQITDLATKNKAMMTIAIDATEIDLTDEFMLPTPYGFEDAQ